VGYAYPDDDRRQHDLQHDHQHDGDGALTEQGSQAEPDEESDRGFELNPKPGLEKSPRFRGIAAACWFVPG
jgi:hypothetical protein